MVVTFVSPEPGHPVGEALREARLAAGLSQTDVAHRSGVARPNISAIESGSRSPSPEMTRRILDAIRGRPLTPLLHLSPAVLANIELSRVAAFRIIQDPDKARERMQEELASLRGSDDGSAASWLEYWGDLLERWDTGEVVRLLLSTDVEDVERRKVSPVRAVVSADEVTGALGRAQQVWRATRRL
jgi:transcriptional regulator with XRE-family HTH domain